MLKILSCVRQYHSGTASHFLCKNVAFIKSHLCSAITTGTAAALVTEIKEDTPRSSSPNNPADLFKKWGCSDREIHKLFVRQPILQRTDPKHLEPKLRLLGQLGLKSSDLVEIVHRRPKFLSTQFGQYFHDERLEHLESIFGSREVLLKAIVRNPSIVVYDFHTIVKPVVTLYEQMGISREELIPLILSRPTLIRRTKMNEEKLDYIRRTGLTKETKMYKHVVTIIGVSKVETIREKIANFDKFGFSEDDVLDLFARCPVILTLSVDKIQRHMTYLLGTMQLPAETVLRYPFLLSFNLETVLKPRMLLARKIEDMDLAPRIEGPDIFCALRMSEKRFIRRYVTCHPKDISDELLQCYGKAKVVLRLAQASKSTSRRGFPV